MQRTGFPEFPQRNEDALASRYALKALFINIIIKYIINFKT